jgi:hypothetical protein
MSSEGRAAFLSALGLGAEFCECRVSGFSVLLVLWLDDFPLGPLLWLADVWLEMCRSTG